MLKRAAICILALLLCVGCAAAETTKTEHVFVVSHPDGSIADLVDTVRLSNPDRLDVLSDNTCLEGIENIGGEETFVRDDTTITWQANGNEILYQGTSGKAPLAVPVITAEVDGNATPVRELTGASGHITLTIRYAQETPLPCFAATLLLLPQSARNLTLTNAKAFSLSGQQAIIGWGIPGADEAIGLPDSFSLSFDAEDVSLDLMMSIVTMDPIREGIDRAGISDAELHLELEEAVSLLTALSAGTTLPETTGKTKDIPGKINELNDGLNQLEDGAHQLADGADALNVGAAKLYLGMTLLDKGAASLSDGTQQLAEGTQQLSTGLTALSQNSPALNDGADAILSALLESANRQLSESALSQFGLSVPQLTPENYRETLDTLIAKLSPDAVKEMAEQAVREKVEASVRENAEAVSSAVKEKVRASVLDSVLAAAGIEMDAESYEKRTAGSVNEKTAAAIEESLKAQMASEAIKAKIEELTEAEINALVDQALPEAMNSDEVKAMMADAAAGLESLKALRAQLEQVDALVAGVHVYTDGVDQANAGAHELLNGANAASSGAETLSGSVKKLNDGVAQLKDGTKALSEGAKTLHETGIVTLRDSILDAEKKGAGFLLPYVDENMRDALRIYENTCEQVKNNGYDLAPQSGTQNTLYIIRTDLM